MVAVIRNFRRPADAVCQELRRTPVVMCFLSYDRICLQRSKRWLIPVWVKPRQKQPTPNDIERAFAGRKGPR